ncbi:hypothetical protein IG631_08742 [Alternaria alternata]|nr:hypothetical protein IG631_08742 [Alternaria alternata]
MQHVGECEGVLLTNPASTNPWVARCRTIPNEEGGAPKMPRGRGSVVAMFTHARHVGTFSKSGRKSIKMPLTTHSSLHISIDAPTFYTTLPIPHKSSFIHLRPP